MKRNLKKTLVLFLVATFCLSVLLTGCGGQQQQAPSSSAPQSSASAPAASSAPSAQKIVLKFGELNPDGHPMTVAAREFAKIVKEKSKGKIEIEVYPASQLGDEKTELQGIQMGGIDFFRANTVSLGDFGAKKSNIFSLPYVFRDRDHIWKVLNSAVGEEILNDVQASGSKMVGIGFVEEGPRHFFFRNKEVKSVADMKGLKIRVPQTQILMDTVAAFGASPTPISYSELYSSLQTGVVDGAENPPTGYLANKFYEVSKYYTLDAHTYSPGMIVMSEITWKKLSADDQKVIKESAKEVEKFVRVEAEKADNKAFEDLKAKGAVITPVKDQAEWQNAVKPLYDKYGKDYKALLDAIANIK